MNNNFIEAVESQLVNNFKLYFPYVADGVVEMRVDPHDPYCLIATYDDDSSLLYNDMDHTIRNLPHHKNAMSKTETLSEFGIRLRKIMFRKNISQLELADMTKISNVTLSKYMNGQTMPSLYALDKIAKALGCSVDEFRYV